MKANELMVGDWVLFKGKPTKVTQGHIVYMMSDRYSKEYQEGTQPIPITEELLEKNGFNLHDDMYTNDVMTLHDDKKFIRTKNAWSVGVYKNECHRIAQCELTYLHELQHLLKLCKINFEFVV